MEFLPDTFVKETCKDPRIGYIKHGGLNNVYVIFIRNADGSRSKAEGWFEKTSLKILPFELLDQDVLDLQRLAVEWNDRDWFTELGQKYKKGVK